MQPKTATPQEIRISRHLRAIMDKVLQHITRLTGVDCCVTILISPKNGYEGNVVSYISNVQRQSAAFMMADLLCRWMDSETDTPAHLWIDDQGRTLSDILGEHGPH